MTDEPIHHNLPGPSERFKRIFAFASDEADGLGHGFVTCQHLLYALTRENRGMASAALNKANITPERVHKVLLDSSAVHDRTGEGQIDLSTEVRDAVARAVKIAVEWNSRTVDSEHLLYGLLVEPSSVDEILSLLNVAPQNILTIFQEMRQTAPEDIIREEATHAYRFTIESAWLLSLAMETARELGASEVSSMHLLIALSRLDGPVKVMLDTSFGVTDDILIRRMGGDFPVEQHRGRLPLTSDVQRILGFSIGEAWNRGHLAVTPLHIAFAFTRGDRSPALDVLAEYGASADNLMEELDGLMPPRVS